MASAGEVHSVLLPVQYSVSSPGNWTLADPKLDSRSTDYTNRNLEKREVDTERERRGRASYFACATQKEKLIKKKGGQESSHTPPESSTNYNEPDRKQTCQPNRRKLKTTLKRAEGIPFPKEREKRSFGQFTLNMLLWVHLSKRKRTGVLTTSTT